MALVAKFRTAGGIARPVRPGRAGPPNARDFGSPTRPARLESYSKKYFGFADALPEIVRTDLDETRRLRTRADAEVS